MSLTNTYFIPEGSTEKVPCIFIRNQPHGRVYIEVVNEPKPNGKPDYTNTSIHGNLLQIHETQLVTNG